jgi:1-aminocyclopropane-1-carboxylate deaminase
MNFIDESKAVLHKLEGPLFPASVDVFIKRDDLLHPEISGNKWWKLKYNLLEAQRRGGGKIITFGGAFSNHIAATAAAGRALGFETIGVIRGERPGKLSHTLENAAADGMELVFVTREQYKKKDEIAFKKSLVDTFGNIFLIPEGGKNLFGVKGCTEILTAVKGDFDFICCACGTGTTLAGLAISAAPSAKVLGFSALKGGEFLQADVKGLIRDFYTTFNFKPVSANFDIVTDFHFGGYAKVKPPLIDFQKEFMYHYNIELDLVYTAKMFYGIRELALRGYFPSGSRVLAIHSGGLQGNRGFLQQIAGD